MEQPAQARQRRRDYDGPIADDVLAAGGITLSGDWSRYRDAVAAVVERGYELAGGKLDRRGMGLGLKSEGVKEQAVTMRHSGMTLREIAHQLNVSITTVYRICRRQPMRVA
jgi:DNA-binding IclR family transcriptional regulator